MNTMLKTLKKKLRLLPETETETETRGEEIPSTEGESNGLTRTKRHRLEVEASEVRAGRYSVTLGVRG